MRSVAVSVMVDAPLTRVWEVLADLPSHTEWMADAEAIEFPTGRCSGTGTVMVVDSRVGPFRLKDRLEVTEWVAPRTIRVAHRGAVQGTGRFDLAPMAGGVRVTWSEDLRFPWRLGGPMTAQLARPFLALVWSRSLRRFREMVESGFSGR